MVVADRSIRTILPAAVIIAAARRLPAGGSRTVRPVAVVLVFLVVLCFFCRSFFSRFVSFVAMDVWLDTGVVPG